MNTIKFIMVVSMVLLGTGLVYHQVVNGQNLSRMALLCIDYEDKHLVVLRIRCDESEKAISWFISQGYEIKQTAEQLVYGDSQTIMYLERGVIK